MRRSTQITAAREDLRKRLGREGRLVVLSGAGISAESGIPTFRGKEGYWVVGSKEYQPQEMATYRMFRRRPEAVWAWYLYRRGVCRAARPNAGHRAVVDVEQKLGDRFRLITQNVDGLHLHAGSSLERTYQIHGNIDFARCAAECGRRRWLLPASLGLNKPKGEGLTESEKDQLRCPDCGGWARPHVLWFDENYDEERYRFQSSLRAASEADVLLVVGTSGATNLPALVGRQAAASGALLIDVNPEPNLFSQLAERQGGFFIEGLSGQVLPALLAV